RRAGARGWSRSARRASPGRAWIHVPAVARSCHGPERPRRCDRTALGADPRARALLRSGRMIGVSTVSLFYALLALVANAAVIGMLALAVAARRSPAAGRSLEDLRSSAGSSALVAAFVVATLATLGSLYFSEVAHFEPCRLCWYQRIAMYPLVVILGIAALRRDRSGAVYGLALALIGAVVSAYHVLLEWFPSLDGGTCDPT